jgi:hypothetical protein
MGALGDMEEAGVNIPQQVRLHTPMYVSSPHASMYVSSYFYMCVLILLYVSSYSLNTPICILILQYISPHTPTCVSSYSYMLVLLLL